MPVNNTKEKVHLAMMEFEGVSSNIHRFGGTEYKLGKREIGHIHGNYIVDIPFPLKLRTEIIRNGEAEPHHILPESGWVSVFLHNESDVNRAIALLRRSYELALMQMKRRSQQHQNYTVL